MDMLDFALATINRAKNLIGGQFALLECKNISYLRKLYEGVGFQYIQLNPTTPELMQFILFL